VTGFSNNMALGRLILDGAENSSFRFAGSKKNRAMYVDYLELRNYATNYLDDLAGASIQIDPNLTIYFANANLPPSKLNGNGGGRLLWLPSFYGPLSTTNIVVTYTNLYGEVFSRNYLMNTALATSKDLDTDGDCLVNAEDFDPLYPSNGPCAPVPLLSSAESVSAANRLGRLTIVLDRRRLGSWALLSWEGLAEADNVVEFTESLVLTDWQTLTNCLTGPTSRRLTVADELPSRGHRFYRVRVLAPATK
jgi:hypothetical protein